MSCRIINKIVRIYNKYLKKKEKHKLKRNDHMVKKYRKISSNFDYQKQNKNKTKRETEETWKIHQSVNQQIKNRNIIIVILDDYSFA